MPIDPNNSSNFSFNDLPRPQKTAVILLSLFAVFILFFWLWQFQAKLKSPFAPPEGYEDYQETLSADPSLSDTDNDGLNDGDEELYGTSRYIEDTDSDGLSDSEEVLAGTDPLCAAGSNCFRSDDIDTGIIASSSDETDVEMSTEEEAALQALITGQSDAASIRQFLLDNGVSAEDLADISDEALLSNYQQVIEEGMSEE
jgi:hypothetical protein